MNNKKSKTKRAGITRGHTSVNEQKPHYAHMMTIMVTINDREHMRALLALAAFNGISIEQCAKRILLDNLASLHEEMNFRGAMIV